MSKTDFETLAALLYETLQTVRPGMVFKHIKSGKIYKVTEVFLRESDLKPWVVYKPFDDHTELVKFGRSAEEFLNKFVIIYQRIPAGNY